mgnify:CR=1 FL=1
MKLNVLCGDENLNTDQWGAPHLGLRRQEDDTTSVRAVVRGFCFSESFARLINTHSVVFGTDCCACALVSHGSAERLGCRVVVLRPRRGSGLHG